MLLNGRELQVKPLVGIYHISSHARRQCDHFYETLMFSSRVYHKPRPNEAAILAEP